MARAADKKGKSNKGVIKGSQKTFQTRGMDKDNNDVHIRNFAAKKDGKLVSRTQSFISTRNLGGNPVTSFPQKTTVLDTTGYSKGKQSFPAKQRTYNAANIDFRNFGEKGRRSGTGTYNTFDVDRKDVKKVISQMKSGTGINQQNKKVKTPPKPAPKPAPKVVPKPAQSKTVSQIWKEKTGKDWSEAKKLGLSDGSAASNNALLKKLNSGSLKSSDLKPKAVSKPATVPTREEAIKTGESLVRMRRGGKYKTPTTKKSPMGRKKK
jgi:hypothetical protein